MPPGLKPALWQAAKIAVPVLSSVLALVIVGQFIDWRAALDDALRAPPWAMAAGVALIWLQLSLCGLRLRLLALSFGAEMPLRAATSVWSLSYLGGLVLPTSVGSELVKGAALLGWTRLPVTIIGLLALERLAAILALLLLVLIAAPLAAWRIGSEYALPLGMLCALAFAAICFGLAMRQRAAAGLRWLLTACRVPVGVVDKLVAAVGAAPLGRVVGLSLAIHLMTLIVIGLLLFGFSSRSPLLEAALGGPLVTFASLLPISVGGFGVREGAFILVLGPMGVDASQAVGVALAWWGVQVLAGLTAAATAAAWLLASRQKRVQRELSA